MNPIEELRARIVSLREAIKTALEQRGAIADKALTEKREMSDDEKTAFERHAAERAAAERDLKLATERLAELEEISRMGQLADAARGEGGTKVTDAPVYARGNHARSFFRDLHLARSQNDPDALDRLRRSAKMDAEKRANEVGTPTLPGGVPSGNAGVFAPPAWMIDQFVALARSGRVGVDTFDKMPLPAGVSSINIPKLTGGTSVGLATEMTPLTGTDITTTSVSSGITTIGGKAIASLQLLEQSGLPIDDLLLSDLARAYAQDIGGRGLNGDGTSGNLRGLLHATGLQTIDATVGGTVSPVTATDIYQDISQANAKVHAAIFAEADTLLLTPGSWSNLVATADSTNRPLIAPVSPWNNPVENPNLNVAQGQVGRILNLDVFVDPHMPAGTAAVYRRSDIKLWESGVRVETFTQPYAESAGVLYRILGFAALIPDRYGAAVVTITGLPELS